MYHVPECIRKYGNIKQFSGQGRYTTTTTVMRNMSTKFSTCAGVEKNNDDARRNYFSSNLQDAPGEILKAEGRLEQTQEYKRTKRTYTKRKADYWHNGGIEEARKMRRDETTQLTYNC